MAKKNDADVWVSEKNFLNYDSNNFFILKAIEEGEVGLDKILFDYERENTIPEENLKDWRRGCRNPQCGKGDEQLTFNGNKIETENIDETLDSIIENNDLGDRILVEAGHYIPDLRDTKDVSGQPLQALKEGIKIIEKIYDSGKKADLLIFVNDLNMGKGNAEENRDKYFEDYVLPTKMAEVIEESRKKGYEFNVIIAGETKLSRKLQRDRKNRLKKGLLIKEKISEKESEYFVQTNLEKYLIISNVKYKSSDVENTPSKVENTPNPSLLKCLAACTRVVSLAKEMGYTGMLQVYPVCAPGSVEPAVIINKALYPDKTIPVMNLYRTVTCFRKK